ncbi:sensor histidine kinase [Haloimpatiens sp. FM7315]|uniref:sensor histidine kinase n=1 Tax=Haloimpatiens sp. FM7315 TaxID=3298609 RepID=UPI00370C0604
MKSIKKRLTINFMVVIFITVAIFESLLINAVKKYYYDNIQNTLITQIKLSCDFYSKYFSNASLKENILDNVDVFWKQTSAQVQIIDSNGNILMDSIGVIPLTPLKDSELKAALKGEIGKKIGRVSYSKNEVLAVTHPLKSNGKIVGALRFITSLEPVKSQIKYISFIFIFIGSFAIIVSGIISLFLSDTIIGPIKELTAVAEKMANGNLKIRSEKKFNDEIGKLSDTLNYMAEEILKKDQLKNEFISSVSHELRTPLTSIKGWAITLKTDELNDKALIRDGLEIIENESDRLSSMVEELLDFSKFVSGKITLKKQKINLNNIFKYIEKQMNPRALRDNINFIVNTNINLPEILLDSNRIKQVLINLIDNAFNFTPSNGTITLSAETDKHYLTISVRDTGFGISPKELPKIKEKFYKGKSSRSKNGIGLSICDEIIKMHNGQFIIDSILNIGTVVYVKLPLE